MKITEWWRRHWRLWRRIDSPNPLDKGGLEFREDLEYAGRLKPEGIGVVGNNKDVGFFLHPTMILDAETGFPLGLSAIQLWTREPGHPTKKELDYQTLPIEKRIVQVDCLG